MARDSERRYVHDHLIICYLVADSHICLTGVVIVMEINPFLPVLQCHPMTLFQAVGCHPASWSNILLRF